MEDKSAYTPVVQGASPDNPIATEQYGSADDVHPNREDWDEARRQFRQKQILEHSVRTRDKTFLDKLGGGLDWIILKNNSIRLPSYLWIIVFGLWWIAMMVHAYWLPASLMAVYSQMHYTFDLQPTADILHWFSISLNFVFPIYVILWGILSIYESIRKWQQRKEGMVYQERFGG
jgi:hypothetical protein